jgi:TolA-binding protein
VLANDIANAQQRQKDFYVDLDARLRKLEPQQVQVDGQTVAVGVSEQQAYDAALSQFKGGDYKGAGNAFADFLKRYPQSGYAASAQYWQAMPVRPARLQGCHRCAAGGGEELSGQPQGR